MRISRRVRAKGWYLFRNHRVALEMDSGRRLYFKVKGETDIHSVIFDREKSDWSCSCEYWTLKQKWCSHIYACWLWLKEAKK